MRATAAENDELDYPAEDGVAETKPHFLVRTLLHDLVRRWLAERGVRAFVGSDQLVYWVQGDLTRTVAPDLFVVDGDPDAPVRTWKVWERGAVPRFGLEVVSDDVRKDYVHAPDRYDEMGVDELVVFDPDAEPGTDRVRWQVYRRSVEGLRRVYSGDADRVFSRVLGCFLRSVDGAGHRMVRLGSGTTGDDLFPTGEEAAVAEKDVAVAEKEAERARRVALEAEVAELRRRLGDS